MSTASTGPDAAPRSTLRSVAVPTEHGGWGLTLEPVLLGLLVAPSVGGACLGLAAFVAFLARTPAKVVLVDAHRGRSLERTRLARRVLAIEGLVLVALVAVVVREASPGWWRPLVVLAPLVAVELWFDMRSRSRRLAPELAGAVGIGGVVALIVMADGGAVTLAVGLWLILTGRAVTAIVSVRSQVAILHDRPAHPRQLLVADTVAIVGVAAAVALDAATLAGAVAVVVAVVVQRALALTPPPRAVILGVRQTVLGLVVVLVTAAGVAL